MKAILDKINELIDLGWRSKDAEFYDQWQSRVKQILAAGFDQEVAREFTSLNDEFSWQWEKVRPKQIGYLEGLALKTSAKLTLSQKSVAQGSTNTLPVTNKTNKVFIVHGHDSATKESVARYLEKIGLDPIILHEQPNGGKTIIEKFEVYSDVGFAVILLTPDDVGNTKDNKDSLKARARQNVIMELGYFLGKLGRARVCALYKEGVEIPSDYQGVLYTVHDASEGWKIKLAQELNECGFALNIGAILNK